VRKRLGVLGVLGRRSWACSAAGAGRARCESGGAVLGVLAAGAGRARRRRWAVLGGGHVAGEEERIDREGFGGRMGWGRLTPTHFGPSRERGGNFSVEAGSAE
jgi:hypothetical protein